jgi:hypothetical protein
LKKALFKSPQLKTELLGKPASVAYSTAMRIIRAQLYADAFRLFNQSFYVVRYPYFSGRVVYVVAKRGRLGQADQHAGDILDMRQG